MYVLEHLADYGGLLASITAGLTALGWLVRRGLKVARQIDALHDLAQYELKPNGGGSIKDKVNQIPGLVMRVGALETAVKDLQHAKEVFHGGDDICGR